jgi:hypothetical protein
MPYKITSQADIESALNDLERKIEIFLGPKNIDLRERKIVNAGHSRELRDYTTREDLLNLKKQIQESLSAIDTELARLDQRVFDLENP